MRQRCRDVRSADVQRQAGDCRVEHGNFVREQIGDRYQRAKRRRHLAGGGPRVQRDVGAEILQRAVDDASHRIAAVGARRGDDDGGARIDAMEPHAELRVRVRRREQVDVRRKLGSIDVFAARAVVHRRAAERDLNRVAVRPYLGRRNLDGERRDARRLLIDGDLDDVQRRAVLLEQPAQRRAPCIDLRLRRRRRHGQPHRNVARLQRREPSVELGVGWKRRRRHVDGDWERHRAGVVQRLEGRAARFIGDGQTRRRRGGRGVGGRSRRGSRAEHQSTREERQHRAARAPQRDMAVLHHVPEIGVMSLMRPNDACRKTSASRRANPLSRK